MTSIEVPDWVVSKVLDELFPGNSGYVIPNYREPMKAALSAALGAWVVRDLITSSARSLA